MCWTDTVDKCRHGKQDLDLIRTTEVAVRTDHTTYCDDTVEAWEFHTSPLESCKGLSRKERLLYIVHRRDGASLSVQWSATVVTWTALEAGHQETSRLSPVVHRVPLTR